MSKQHKKHKQQQATTKKKLRTASDVISRLKWSSPNLNFGGEEQENSEVMIGYDDRIHGPMEKSVHDFVPASNGGDIPEHRILYFRNAVSKEKMKFGDDQNDCSFVRDADIIWDRAGRVDRLFGSGRGSNESVDSRTLKAANLAVLTMKRLEKEREERRAIKSQQRARKMAARRRRQQQQQQQQHIPGEKEMTASPQSKLFEKDQHKANRFNWASIPWFVFNDERIPSSSFKVSGSDDEDDNNDDGLLSCWECGSIEKEKKYDDNKKMGGGEEELTVVTWNVLFDHFENSSKSSGKNNSGGEKLVMLDAEKSDKFSSTKRWNMSIKILQQTNADIIALQEVTPTFASMLLSKDWVKFNYASSASPDNEFLETIRPHGCMILWKRSKFLPFSSSSPSLMENSDDGESSSLFVCRDGDRNRSLIAVLTTTKLPDDTSSSSSPPSSKNVIMVGNIHLPADRIISHERRENRQVARRRELRACIGQFQKLEHQILFWTTNIPKQKYIPVRIAPIVMGDFNCDSTTLCDGSFEEGKSTTSAENGGFFTDVWPLLKTKNHNEIDEDGFTFDPTSNILAMKCSTETFGSGVPKRIDRIYIGRHGRKPNKDHDNFGDELTLEPIRAHLLGRSSSPDGCSSSSLPPPSDHYGVCATLKFPITQEEERSEKATIVNKKNVSERLTHSPLFRSNTSKATAGHAYDAFAANSLPNTDYMLGIVINDTIMERLKNRFDPESSLIVPHITLLHGFAEVNNVDSRTMIVDAVRDAMMDCVMDDSASEDTEEEEGIISLRFSSSGLDVFEHRSSATLICRPDSIEYNGDDGGLSWLRQLYNALRDRFRLCDEQEKHSDDGSWNPHVTLGKFGSSSQARSTCSQWLNNSNNSNSGKSSSSWHSQPINIPLRSIDIFERGSEDGKFRTIASIPISKHPPSPSSSSFRSLLLSDCGRSLSMYSKTCNLSAVSVLERCCRNAVKRCFRGSGDDDDAFVESKVMISGSARLGVSLPSISDCDVFILLKPLIVSESSSSSDNEDKIFAVPHDSGEENVKREGGGRGERPPFSKEAEEKWVQELIAHLQSVAKDGTFFRVVSDEILKTYPNAKTRVRTAGPKDSTLTMLKSKISNLIPSLDTLLCICDVDGNPLNDESRRIINGAADVDAMLQYVQNIATAIENGSSEQAFLRETFKGVVRLVKFWANSRGIYGSEMGFLGGGGWALFVARIMSDLLQKKKGIDENTCNEFIRNQMKSCRDVNESALFMTRMFFVEAARWPWPLPVELVEDNTTNNNNTNIRDTMTLVPPVGSGDYGRNSTKSTQLATLEELQLAASHFEITTRPQQAATAEATTTISLDSILKTMDKVLHRKTLTEFITSFKTIVVLELLFDGPPKKKARGIPLGGLAELKKWGSSRMITLIVELERKIDLLLSLRPQCKPLRAHAEWNPITCCAGVKSPISGGGSTSKDCCTSSGFIWIIGVKHSLQENDVCAIKGMESGIISDLNGAFSCCDVVGTTGGADVGDAWEHRGSGVVLRCGLYVLDSNKGDSHVVRG